MVSLTPMTAFAQSASTEQACQSLESVSPDGTTCSGSGGQVSRLIRLALQMLSIVAGVIAVIMVVISGLKYITSQGDSGQIASAKKSLIYAIVGIVIVAFAQIIVQFSVSVGDDGKLPIVPSNTTTPADKEKDSQQFESAVD